MRWPKYWSFSFSIIPSKAIPGLISFRMDWLGVLAVKGTLKSLLQHHSSISRPYLLSYTISRPHTPPHTLACPCMPSHAIHALTHSRTLSHICACPHCPCMHSHGHTFPSMSSHALTSPHTLSLHDALPIFQPVHSEGDQPWDCFGRNDAKAETPVVWPPYSKS